MIGEIIIFLYILWGGGCINPLIKLTHHIPFNLKSVTSRFGGIKNKMEGDQNEELEANCEKLDNPGPFSLHTSVRNIILCKWKQ